MHRTHILALVAILASCSTPPPPGASTSPTSKAVPMLGSMPPSSGGVVAPTTVAFTNKTTADTVIYVAFGADSVIKAAAWSTFCPASAPLNCTFPLAAGKTQVLPSSDYLNVTMAAGQPVSCGSTKAELNVNHPKAFDVADVSLVDGFNAKISIELNGVLLGPPVGKEGNEKVFGLYPLGCDICTAQLSPPCGIKPGGPGCKAGSQYKPDVPCQAQGPLVGGGGAVQINLLP